MKTVCFFGDSITRRGYWLAEVFEHLRKKGTVVWNCGVSGDNATYSLQRVYTDCLNRTPDTVVVMFGINDVQRTPDGVGEKHEARLEKYKRSLETLTDLLQRAGAGVILCTATPLLDTGIGRDNDGLARAAEIVRALAAEKGLPCVDFFSYLLPLVGKEYAMLPDNVHPQPESHHYMAQFFMKELGWIDEIDETPFLPMCEEAQARFDIDQKLREIYFIEWNQMFTYRSDHTKTHADMLALATERLSAAKEANDELKIRWYTYYLENVEKKLAYEAELVKRTLEMAHDS